MKDCLNRKPQQVGPCVGLVGKIMEKRTQGLADMTVVGVSHPPQFKIAFVQLAVVLGYRIQGGGAVLTASIPSLYNFIVVPHYGGVRWNKILRRVGNQSKLQYGDPPGQPGVAVVKNNVAWLATVPIGYLDHCPETNAVNTVIKPKVMEISS